MSRHTAGPWEARRRAVYAPTPGGPGTRFVVATACDIPLGSEEEAVANARLVAAAPHLLAACEGLLGWAHDREDVDIRHEEFGLWLDASDAVARAKGENP